ncbi:damage-control phosphatase ARMT1-like [Cochliomyia hominivorax]
MNTKITAAEFDSKYDIIDSTTPRHIALSGRYKRSFAYHTLRERLPVILTEIIDQLNRDKDEIAGLGNGEETREEIKSVVGQISKLKYQLQTDKKFEKFTGEEPDKDLWNDFISKLPSDACSFFRSCWLYAECYMYRKVSSFFESTKNLKTFDYFAKQKQNGLKIEGVVGVAKVVKHAENDLTTFGNLVKLNLWGNKCDLSLIIPKEFKPSDNIFEQLESFNSNILVDNIKQIWQCLESADRSKPVIVEFVNDNAGFELYTDLVLADYILEKQLATKVRFSVKAIPWYVSDVVPTDIPWTLDYLSKHDSGYIKELATKWKQYFEEGKFVLSPINYFWVSPYEFYKMREMDPDLYKYLAEAHLVIFKGDLNYRKLLGDMNWDPTDDFLTCLRGFLPTNICSFRTVKADLICGLSQGKAEELTRMDPQWMCTGEYGVIQFMDKISCSCNETKSN